VFEIGISWVAVGCTQHANHLLAAGLWFPEQCFQSFHKLFGNHDFARVHPRDQVAVLRLQVDDLVVPCLTQDVLDLANDLWKRFDCIVAIQHHR
jgi:hypothetical protein